MLLRIGTDLRRIIIEFSNPAGYCDLQKNESWQTHTYSCQTVTGDRRLYHALYIYDGKANISCFPSSKEALASKS